MTDLRRAAVGGPVGRASCPRSCLSSGKAQKLLLSRSPSLARLQLDAAPLHQSCSRAAMDRSLASSSRPPTPRGLGRGESPRRCRKVVVAASGASSCCMSTKPLSSLEYKGVEGSSLPVSKFTLCSRALLEALDLEVGFSVFGCQDSLIPTKYNGCPSTSSRYAWNACTSTGTANESSKCRRVDPSFIPLESVWPSCSSPESACWLMPCTNSR
mmetsp:Transcript_48983/g.148609  ORF Transcript_48983/g.148609 Transcript_48983/m.148609 type:complete len:213 (+) Transcript_48983:154-792(+)